MIMGSDESVGRVAAMKLNHTAGNFLATPVELEGSQKQMQPVKMQSLGTFCASGSDIWLEINEFLRDLETPAWSRRPQRKRKTDAKKTQPVQLAMVKDGDRQEEVNELLTTETVREEASEHDTSPPLTASTPQDRLSHRNEPPQTDNSIEDGLDEIGLSNYLRGEGVLLKARCPKQTHIQIVLGHAGELHLLAGYIQNGDEPDISMRLDAVVTDLLKVSHWVNEHLNLIQLTHPDREINAQGQPVLHLFTNQAKPAVTLAGRLGNRLKLHLLQNVCVGETQSRLATELN